MPNHSTQPLPGVSPHTAMHLLLCTVHGVAFGFDVEHIAAIGMADSQSPNSAAALRLLRMLGMPEESDSHPAPIPATTPFVLSTRTRTGIRPIAVDNLEDIGEVDSAQLRPLPATIEPWCLRSGIWAVWLHGSRMVLLLDPLRWEPSPATGPSFPLPS